MPVRQAAAPTNASSLATEVVDFLQSGASIVAAAAAKDGSPQLAFAFGCRVIRRPVRVRIFLPEARCPHLVQAIRDTGQIAVIFSHPQSHRSLQLKSDGVSIGALKPADRSVPSSHIERLAMSLATIGVGRDLIAAIMTAGDSKFVAVEFTPKAAFSQTPGPLAGRALPL